MCMCIWFCFSGEPWLVSGKSRTIPSVCEKQCHGKRNQPSFSDPLGAEVEEPQLTIGQNPLIGRNVQGKNRLMGLYHANIQSRGSNHRIEGAQKKSELQWLIGWVNFNVLLSPAAWDLRSNSLGVKNRHQVSSASQLLKWRRHHRATLRVIRGTHVQCELGAEHNTVYSQ